jgi:hypothetical protein
VEPRCLVLSSVNLNLYTCLSHSRSLLESNHILRAQFRSAVCFCPCFSSSCSWRHVPVFSVFGQCTTRCSVKVTIICNVYWCRVTGALHTVPVPSSTLNTAVISKRSKLFIGVRRKALWFGEPSARHVITTNLTLVCAL